MISIMIIIVITMIIINRYIKMVDRYIHSKNIRVSVTRKRVQTPFRVNDDPEISQLDAKYMTESWINLTPLFVNLTDLTDFRATLLSRLWKL